MYCTWLVKDLEVVEDAITGNKLNLREQTIEVTTDAGVDATGTGISGVQRADYLAAKSMSDLAKLLLTPSPDRAQGIHTEQDVLIRAEPGTGKTWAIRQLALMLATELQQPGNEPVPLVPMIVPVQRLAVLMRKASAREREGDLVKFFIEKTFSGNERTMLLQARARVLSAWCPLASCGGRPCGTLSQQLASLGGQ